MNNSSPALTVGVKLGWAVGELAVATYVGLTIAFLLFYSTQVLGIAPWLAGGILLVPRLWDAFSDPFMGVISDHTRTTMGRRRPYLLAGAILLGVSVMGLFYAPADASDMRKAVHVLIFYFASSTAITIFDVPYSSMAAEMTDDYRERTLLTGYKMMAARIGILMVLFGAPAIFGATDNLIDGFRLVGIVFGAFILLTGVASFIFTRRAPSIEAPLKKISIRDELTAIRNNRPFRALWIVFLFQNIAIGASVTTLLYFLTIVIELEAGLISIYMVIGAVTAALATPLWVASARRISKRTGYFIAIAIGIATPLPILFIQADGYYWLIPVLLLAGIGEAANQLFPNAMVPDTVEVEELRTGVRREGAIFGAWAFCRKLGMTIGAFLVSLLLTVSGLVQGAPAAQQPDSAILGVRLIYVFVPITLYLLAMYFLSRYRLSEADFNAVKAEIAETRG